MVSYAAPVAPALPVAVGLDAEIQRLQLLLAAEVPWLQVSYGKAYRATRAGTGGKPRYVPEVYDGGREYRDVLPNDNVEAQSFFYPSGPAVNPDREPLPAQLSLTQSCELIVWGSLAKIDPTKDYRFEHELLADVCRVLNDDGQARLLRVFTAPEDVFKGFTLDGLDEVLRQPYAGFRISLELQAPNILCS